MKSTHKVVRTGSESLNDSHLVRPSFLDRWTPLRTRVSPAQPPPDANECSRPHQGEVDDHRYEDTEDVSDVIEDLLGLFGEDDDDGVQETEEGERRKIGKKLGGKELASADEDDGISSDDTGGERYTEVLEWVLHKYLTQSLCL